MDWLSPRRFTRAERVWIAACAAAAVVLTSAPYLIARALTPAWEQYAWSSVFHYDDVFQYYAWARRIAAGDWLIRNYYTENPESSFALFNPYFLLQGWMTRISGDVFFASHFLRALAVGAYAWVSYAFFALLLPRIGERRIAQVLALAGGLEFPYYLHRLTVELEPRRTTPLADPYVYKILYRNGHLVACLCLLLVAFGCYLTCIASRSAGGRAKGASRAALAALALSTAALGLINPYYLFLEGAALTAHALWRFARSDRRPLAPLVASAIGAAPVALHYHLQPVTGRLGSIRFDEPIGLFDLLLFFPLIGLAAALGWRTWRRAAAESNREAPGFLAVWAVIVVALVLSPLAFRARMTFGLGVALAAPAAAWFGARTARSPWPWLVGALMLLDLGFTAIKEWDDFRALGKGRIDRAMLAAIEAMDVAAQPGEVALALGLTSNPIPAFSKLNVYIGHDFQTERYDEKAREAAAFFGTWDEARRLVFVERIGAAFIFLGPEERRWAPDFELPGWERIYDRSGYVVLRRPRD